MSPQRIQLRRIKGWRKPEGVVVARPSKWGNPYKVVRSVDGRGWMVQGYGTTTWGAVWWTREQATARALKMYSDLRPPGSVFAREAEIQLGGRDLACWCPLDRPCHADVLLDLANGRAGR